MTNVTPQSEWKRRMDLVESSSFRALCAEYAQKLGITAAEWNANRASILLFFANEMCARENAEK